MALARVFMKDASKKEVVAIFRSCQSGQQDSSANDTRQQAIRDW